MRVLVLRSRRQQASTRASTESTCDGLWFPGCIYRSHRWKSSRGCQPPRALSDARPVAVVHAFFSRLLATERTARGTAWRAGSAFHGTPTVFVTYVWRVVPATLKRGRWYTAIGSPATYQDVNHFYAGGRQPFRRYSCICFSSHDNSIAIVNGNFNAKLLWKRK